MAKINKKNTQDLFEGLKYVDKLLNEAAGVGNPPKQLTFEEKMKLKLKEGIDTAEDLDEMTSMEDSLEEDTLEEYTYNAPSEEGTDFLGEDDLDDEFSMDSEDEFGLEDELNFDDEIGADDSAAKFAHQDMEDEFSMGDDDEFSLGGEDDMEEAFDFTEDADLMEALLEADPIVDPAAETEVPAMDATAPVGDETAPIDATATDDLGVDAGTEDPTMDADAGMDASMGGMDMGGAPAMGSEPSGMDDAGTDMGTTPVSEPEDIDQLIADLVKGTGAEEKQPAVFGENAHKDLGYTDLKDEDITSNKVKMESKEKIKEGEIKLTKLKDEFGTPSSVKGAVAGKAVNHSGTGKRVDPKGSEFTDLGDDDITSGKVAKTAEKAAAPAQPKFAEIKKENEQKTKALYTLAEKVITLEDEIANLKFAKFKLEKVNSVLTLLPELKLATREKLVSKFDECKSYAEAKKLYSEVAVMVKDHKRGSLNEAVSKTQSSSVKYFGESVDSEETQADDAATRRRNMLMGLKGSDDAYGQY